MQDYNLNPNYRFPPPDIRPSTEYTAMDIEEASSAFSKNADEPEMHIEERHTPSSPPALSAASANSSYTFPPQQPLQYQPQQQQQQYIPLHYQTQQIQQDQQVLHSAAPMPQQGPSLRKPNLSLKAPSLSIPTRRNVDKSAEFYYASLSPSTMAAPTSYHQQTSPFAVQTNSSNATTTTAAPGYTGPIVRRHNSLSKFFHVPQHLVHALASSPKPVMEQRCTYNSNPVTEEETSVQHHAYAQQQASQDAYKIIRIDTYRRPIVPVNQSITISNQNQLLLELPAFEHGPVIVRKPRKRQSRKALQRWRITNFGYIEHEQDTNLVLTATEFNNQIIITAKPKRGNEPEITSVAASPLGEEMFDLSLTQLAASSRFPQTSTSKHVYDQDKVTSCQIWRIKQVEHAGTNLKYICCYYYPDLVFTLSHEKIKTKGLKTAHYIYLNPVSPVPCSSQHWIVETAT